MGKTKRALAARFLGVVTEKSDNYGNSVCQFPLIYLPSVQSQTFLSFLAPIRLLPLLQLLQCAPVCCSCYNLLQRRQRLQWPQGALARGFSSRHSWKALGRDLTKACHGPVLRAAAPAATAAWQHAASNYSGHNIGNMRPFETATKLR